MKNIFLRIKRSLKTKRGRKRKRLSSLGLLSKYKKNPKAKRYSNVENKLVIGLIFFGVLLLAVWTSVCIYKLITAKMSPDIRDRREGDELEWKGENQINILLVGVDKREGEFGYIDALTVMMIDPLDKRIGLFVINVDTTVNLGGGRYSELRNIYNLGVLESDEVPVRMLIGGVELLLSIKINRYMIIDEEGFVKLSNSLGGIHIKNLSSIKDADINATSGKFELPEGSFRLGGEEFLNFLHADDDGVENKYVRHIEGVEGFLRRATSYNAFLRFPSYIEVFQDNVKTNLSKQELLKVSYEIMRAQEINSAFMRNSSLQKKILGEETAYFAILEVLDEDIKSVFSDSRIAKEQARVEIVNSTSIQGLATFRARWLRNIGVDVIRTGDAVKPYETTTIFCVDPKKYVNTINAIKKTFDEEIETESRMPDFICTGDVIIVLGQNASN